MNVSGSKCLIFQSFAPPVVVASEIKFIMKGTFNVPFRKCGTRRDRRERRLATEALSDLMRSESLENYDNFLQGEDAGTDEACQWTRT